MPLQGRSRGDNVYLSKDKSGSGNETMIDPEEVTSAVSELPEVKEDLENMIKKLEEVSEPLEATWIGTARDSYAKAAFCVSQNIKRIENGIGGLHGVMIETCLNRKTLDLTVSAAATTNQNTVYLQK